MKWYALRLLDGGEIVEVKPWLSEPKLHDWPNIYTTNENNYEIIEVNLHQVDIPKHEGDLQ